VQPQRIFYMSPEYFFFFVRSRERLQVHTRAINIECHTELSFYA
jgi:hypothetical protein